MDFLGIGPFEFILILLLGFLFFGPEKLPEMAVKAGRHYRSLKQSYSQLSKTITDDIAAEVKKDGSRKTPHNPADKSQNP